MRATEATRENARSSVSFESGTENLTWLEFDENHPLFRTHLLRRREGLVIPDITGPRLPDRTTLKTESEKESYALISLVLTFPFHLNRNVRQGQSTYWESWEMYEASRKISRIASRVLRNLQEYHNSKNAARVERLLVAESHAKYERQDEVEDIDAFQCEDDHEQEYQVRENYNGIESSTAAMAGVLLSPSFETSKTMECFRTRMCMRACAHSVSVEARRDTESNRFMSVGATSSVGEVVMQEVSEMKFAVHKRRKEATEIEAGSDVRENVQFHAERSETGVSTMGTETTAEILTQGTLGLRPDGITVLHSAETASTQQRDDGTDRNCEELTMQKLSIQIARSMNLNKLQNVAFSMAAEALCTASTRNVQDRSMKDRELKDPLLMYLGGEGGTGKSRVIEALTELARAAGMTGSVRTCAPTGIAASLVGGQTFHSLVGVRGKEDFKLNKTPTKKCIEQLSGMSLLIVDEVSMLSRKNLGALNCFLRHVTEKNIAFGGIHVILCGDFFQIPPVASEPVYLELSEKEGQKNLMDVIGFESWRSTRDVVILKKACGIAQTQHMGRCLTGFGEESLRRRMLKC